MTLTEILTVCATLLSPLIAVQVTRYLDDRNEIKNRKLNIFKTLMATRANNVTYRHVEALNRISLEFSTKYPKEKIVLEIWGQYLDHLGNTAVDENVWASRRLDLSVDLLYAMCQALNYDFDKVQIKNGIYSPRGHGLIDEENHVIRLKWLEVLKGERAVKMKIENE